MARPTSGSLTARDLGPIARGLVRANARLARALPGDLTGRQPVHTVYGGAHLFNRETPAKLAKLARAAFELHAWQLTEDQEIRRFVAMVRRLPRAARRLWDGAQSRTFDIGVQARKTPRSAVFTLSAATIAAVASVGGRIAVTTYAPEPPELRLTHERAPAGKAKAARSRRIA